MDVARYTFQSPYSSQVQIGQLDPSSVKQEDKSKQEVLTKPEPLPDSQRQSVQVSASPDVLLDIYV